MLGYTDDQFRELENALKRIGPVPYELDNGVVNLSVMPEEDYETGRLLPWPWASTRLPRPTTRPQDDASFIVRLETRTGLGPQDLAVLDLKPARC